MELVWSFVNRDIEETPLLMQEMKICRLFISIGSIGFFTVDQFLLAFEVLAVLFQRLLLCRGGLNLLSCWERLVGCPLCAGSFVGPCQSSRKAHKGLEKSALYKGNKPNRATDRRKADPA